MPPAGAAGGCFDDGVDEAYVERVLRLVEQVPPGCATTYGLIGEVAGSGPRLVGRVMSQYGATVPWWRVVRADGTTPDDLVAAASGHWRDEGTPTRSRGRVDLPRCLHLPHADDGAGAADHGA